MLKSAAPPPAGDIESWAQSTAPVEVPVVIGAYSAQPAVPKRTSLPSIEPALWSDVPTWSAPAAVSCGFGEVSAHVVIPMPTASRVAIAAATTQPCRRSPARRPNANAKANGIARMSTRCKKFVNVVGFSNGCAEFALRKPPPLVPSCLIATWLAIGPPGIDCVAPSTVVTIRSPDRFCTTPEAPSTSAANAAIGNSTRVTVRVRSTQKLPIVFDRERTSPRTSATATAMPAAADTKFCTASPAICVRWLMVDSPA